MKRMGTRPGTARSGAFSSSSRSSPVRPDTSGTQRQSARQGTSSRRRPGTAASTRSTAASEGCFLVAVIEGRGIATEVGMAAMDLRTNECHLLQFSDSQTYTKTIHKLCVLNPAELLVSFTMVEPVKSKLVSVISENLPDVDVVPISRKYFNDNLGTDYIRQYELEDDSGTVVSAVAEKVYCLAATAALLKYVQSQQNILFANRSVRFKYEVIEGSMMIDPNTARNLELVVNLNNPKSNHTLFGVLNHTGTPMGARLLRMNVLQPPCDLPTITTRLSAVQDLTETEELFFFAQGALKNFLDVDFLITSLVHAPKHLTVRHAEQAINNVISFKHTVGLIYSLRDAMDGVNNVLLLAIQKTLNDPRLDMINARMEEVINEDVTFQKSAMGLRNQRCYAVKAGFNGLLDVARQTYKETTNDVYDLVTAYTEKYDIPIKVNFNPVVGFYLTATREQLAMRELPLEFINVETKKKLTTFTTLKLLSYNDRIQESLTEVYLMSDKIIEELIADIRKHAAILYKISESIALLDILVSFAHMCTVSDCVRPEFTETLAIKAGRHPIKETVSTDLFVANDIYASEGANMQIITGPNMSGKSTYLRQIALLIIVAQLGAFVPAAYASVRLVDKLFSRIGMDDSLQANASTFMLEMRETAFILQNVTSRSLIIIDELGRGTSTNDGLGITFAVCEELAKSKAFTFMATHFQELASVMDGYPNVVNLHLHVEHNTEVANETLKCSYTVRDGISDEKQYGLKLAQMAGFSERALTRAKDLSCHLRMKIAKSRADNKAAQDDAKNVAALQLTRALVQARRTSTLPEPQLRKYLASLQTEYMEKLAATRTATGSASSLPPASDRALTPSTLNGVSSV
ncbi:muts-like protein 4, isoform CRA_a [Powellomyces hirtus]|nr:muts-like protein 4, isoform CRA_a [Powellomyces hirtus]